jgi:hypothetical protein
VAVDKTVDKALRIAVNRCPIGIAKLCLEK